MDHSDSGMDMGGHGDMGMDHDMGGDMGGGDMGGGDHSSMSMVMTFYYSTTTPLFSDRWTPQNVGQYAGTCIFLIALAVILRVLLALRPILETRLWSTTHIEKEDHDGDSRPLLSSNGKALSLVKRDVGRRWSGWKVSTAMWRATYEVLIAGIGYLLMLAVMTFNVGYFLSVLGGIWLGTFALGGLSFDDNGSIHC